VLYFGVEAKSVYDKKKQEELLDNVNVLYVALTRAEEQLYVISNMNLSKRRSAQNNMCTFFNYLMNKGVLMQINCIMSLEALQNRIRQSMLILQKQFV
jgi:ATP-dependent exoDNAse (exonuclease V) beta subunit